MRCLDRQFCVNEDMFSSLSTVKIAKVSRWDAMRADDEDDGNDKNIH